MTGKRIYREHAFAIWLAVLCVSLVVAGLVIGADAKAAPAPKCERVYAAVETITTHQGTFPLHPTLIAYAKCRQARTAETPFVAPELRGGRCTIARPCTIVRPS